MVLLVSFFVKITLCEDYKNIFDPRRFGFIFLDVSNVHNSFA